jgi:hypothetical protein
MKSNTTALKSLMSLLLIISTSFAIAQNNNQENQNYAIGFTAVPTLISGTDLAVGAKYKFPGVANNTNAIVTILSATGGATLVILDDNTLTKPEAFSPQINIPANSNGLIEFKIEFVKDNGNPKNIDTLRATAMDIDGNSLLHEIDAINMGAGCAVSYLSNNLEISVVQTGYTFTGSNVAGIEYPAVDTSAKQVMFTVSNTTINTFTYKAGANNLDASAVSRQKGIYFKGFNYVPVTILPVKYLSFDAVSANKAVTLNWATTEEINNNHFEVERSFNGSSFTNIGIVLDGFANGTKKVYSLKDNSALLQENAIVYYRLKQVDNNGRFTYSNILVVRTKNENNVEMQVSPNPFVQTLTVRFNSNEKTTNASVRIINLSGQTVINKGVSVNKGFNNVQLNGLSNLPSGVYVASLIVNGKVIENQKIVK